MPSVIERHAAGLNVPEVLKAKYGCRFGIYVIGIFINVPDISFKLRFPKVLINCGRLQTVLHLPNRTTVSKTLEIKNSHLS